MNNVTKQQLEQFAVELNLDEVVEAIENNSPAKVDSFTGLSVIDVLNIIAGEQIKNNQLMERIAIALENK